MTWVVIGGLVMVAATVGLVVSELILARHAAIARAERLAESTSRMLTEQSFRSIDSVALTIHAVADAILQATDRRSGPAVIREILRSRTRTAAELRDIVYVPASGIGAVDVTGNPIPPIDLHQLPYAQAAIRLPDTISFGVPTPGRHIADSTAEAAASGQFHLPMARSIHTREGQLLGIVVGLVNPEFFLASFDAVDAGLHDAIRLIHYDGQLVASTSPHDGAPGTPMRTLPIFTHLLPDAERGTYRFVDPDGTERITAFRVMRTYPLVVSVGFSLADMLYAWRQEAASFVLLGAATVLLVGGAVLLLWRQVRALHRRERDLADSEALKSGILSSALDGIVSIDGDGRIVEFNPAAERIFGHARARAIGAQAEEMLFPPDRQAAHADDLHRYMQGGDVPMAGRRMELAAMRADGSRFPAELAITATQTAGTRVVTAYLRDITERRRNEAELREARERADEANRAKSEFLATVSHEIRTPMNGIMGMASILQETPLAPDQQRYLQTIQSSSESLLGLINDLLDFSKLEAGRVELETNRFDLEGLVEGVVELVAPLAQGRGLMLGWRIGAGVPAMAKGDGGRLRQVLLNLLGNAIKFTPAGSVTMAVTASGGERIRFAVTDTGIGIPEDAVARVFNRFEQVDASITRRFGGTGLGLAIVQRLVGLMGGEVHVESSPGVGSTFWFDVPLSAGGTGEGQDRLAASSAPGPVLVWDPDPRVRELVAAQLRDWGLAADAAASATDAAEKARLAAAEGRPYAVCVTRATGPEPVEGPTWAPQAKVIGLSPIPRPGVAAVICPIQPSVLRRAMEGRAHAADPAPAPADGAEMPALPLDVLVAEDNPTNQQVVAMILRRLGHRVTLVANGREALAMAEARPFDLVLMDVQMPEMSGLEAARRIRRLPPPRGRVPIIAATAMGGAQDRAAFQAAGMDDLLLKPITRATVERALAKLFRFEAPPPEPMPDAAPGDGVDHAVLAQLEAALGPKDLARLVGELTTQTPLLLSEISRALDAGDAPALARTAHILAGTLSNFGLEAAGALARQVEARVRTGDLPDAYGAASELSDAATRSLALLQARYAPAAAG